MNRPHDARSVTVRRTGLSWIGDFVRAQHALGLDLDAACAVLQMLGFDAQLPGPPALAAPEPVRLPKPPDGRPSRMDHAVPRAPLPAPTEPSASASIRVYSECAASTDDRPALAAPAWLEDQPALDLAPRPPRSPPPLFSRLRRRSILVELTARRIADGAPDVRAIVRVLASGQPLRTLPRLRRRTLGFGVEVLLDGTDALQPFRADSAELVAALRDLLPDGRLLVTHVRGGPAGAQVDGPLPRSTVLAVSDFGAGFAHVGERSAPVAHWLRHARQLATADRPLRSLVPLPPQRCAAALQRRVPLVQWSEATTLGDVRRALRPSGAVGTVDGAASRAARQQAAIDLATVLAPALRIDPALLRSARRELLPALGPEAEADLWFGSLVATRGVTGITLHPSKIALLTERLQRDEPVPRERVLGLLERLAAGASESVGLEEALRRGALAGTLDDATIDLALRPVCAALAGGGEAARAAAAWWPQAWQRLPAMVRESAPARQVSLAAAVHLGTGAWLPPTLGGGEARTDIRWLLPESAQQPEDWSVELREYADGELVARLTRDAVPSHAVHRLRVPAGPPRWIGVPGPADIGPSGGAGETALRWLQLEPGLELAHDGSKGRDDAGLVLQTLDGKRVRITMSNHRVGPVGALVHAGNDWFGVAISDDLAVMCPTRREAHALDAQRTIEFVHCKDHRSAGPARFLGALHVPHADDGTAAECWVVRFAPGTLRPIDSEPVRDAGKPAVCVWLRWDGTSVSFAEPGVARVESSYPAFLYPTIELDESSPEPWAFPKEPPKSSNLSSVSVSQRVPIRSLRDDAVALRRRLWICALAASDGLARPAQQLSQELARRLGDWRIAGATLSPSGQPDPLTALLQPDVLVVVGTDPPGSDFERVAAGGVPVLWAPMSTAEPDAALHIWPPALRAAVTQRPWLQFGADEKSIYALADAIVRFGDARYKAVDTIADGAQSAPPAEPKLGAWASLTARARRSLVSKLEESIDPGLHRVPLDGEFRFERVEPSTFDPSRPLLLLLHGQATSARPNFDPLWAPEAAAQLARLREHYGFALAFEYRSITRSLVDTAGDLAAALPYRARLHVVGHSTGGVLGELLCTGQGYEGSFAEMERTQSLARLSSVLREQNLQVEHLVRVAAPMRGASNLSKGLERVSVLAGVVGVALPFLPVSWLAEQLQQLYKDPQSSPGLADILPDSALVELLNDPAAPPVARDSRLTIVAGVQTGGGLGARLRRLSTSLATGGRRNDLLVELLENFGGYARDGGFDSVVFEGPEVSHFNFFGNLASRSAIVDALVAAPSRELRRFESYEQALAQLGPSAALAEL